MAFDISAITSEIRKRGVLRNNKFEMTFGLPAGLQGIPAARELLTIGSVAHLYGESTYLPGVVLTIGEQLRYGYGVKEPFPHAPAFGPLHCKFRADAEGKIIKLFQAWTRIACNYEFRNGISDKSGAVRNQYPYTVAYKSDYAVDLIISLFDDAGNPKVQVMYRDAFPVYSGSDVSLDWRSRGEYLQIPVTFAYTDWNVVDEPITRPTTT